MHPKRPGKANQKLEKLSPEGFVDRENITSVFLIWVG